MNHQFVTPLQENLPYNAHTNFPVILPRKTKRKRSGEMMCVPSLDPQDSLYFHHSVRKTRITFESLRIFLSNDSIPPQRAASLMNDRNLWLNRDKRIIGPIPGVTVGDIFFYRLELCIIGLHGQSQAGIDYVTAKDSEIGEPIATSIVISGGYEDDCDNGNELIYTSHGGRDPKNKHHEGQKLEGGNLALERSMAYGIEVRVVRGIMCSISPSRKVYVYDGLYKVVQCMKENGKSGFCVYGFRLLRIEGQEEMGSFGIMLSKSLKTDPLLVRPTGYLRLDLSKGKEKIPILLFNDIDDLKDPLLFEYVTRPHYSSNLYEKVYSEDGENGYKGCVCAKSCGMHCYCARLNYGELPYNEDGILKRGKPVIYECGVWCKCPPNCGNRVSQGGIRNTFEVFRNLNTKWSVRSLDSITAGSFLFEINGVVLSNKEAKLNGKEYEKYFVYPYAFPRRWTEWGDISDVFPNYKPCSLPPLTELRFAIDVSCARNVACHLSHFENSPNVCVQFVLFDHHNVAYPHLMVFASENIPPLRELSIDYGKSSTEKDVEPWLALTL